jgi:glutamate racemase
MDIGLFDSGIGGLTVLKQISLRAPKNRFIYLADTANLPYGDKTQEQILSYAHSKMLWMKQIGVDVVSIACNTTDSVLSKNSIEDYQKMFKYGIVNIIEPTAIGVIKTLPNIKKIGILATEVTAKNPAFKNAFAKLSSDVQIVIIPCPELVPWIESSMYHYDEGYSLISEYMRPLFEFGIQGLIYGCTHYPFASQVIKDVIIKNNFIPTDIHEKMHNNSITLINPASFVAGVVHDIIHTTESSSDEKFEVECYITDVSAKSRLQQTAEKLFGFIPQIEVIDLKSYTYSQKTDL